MSNSLLIIGASAGAAAFSALRAGLEPSCADLFADLDLLGRSPVRRVTDYPQGFRDVILDASGPWLYTGTLENHRLLVAELARLRPLWGNDVEALNPCRMPELWTQVLQDAGVPCPRVRLAADIAQQPPDPEVRWLVKPLKSAGGSGIRFWDGEPLQGRPAFLQEYKEGVACSALYLGRQRQARLLGVTLQLVGEDWLHAGPFRYCGSIGPLPLNDDLARLGQMLAAGCGIRGLFGVDCVAADGVFWPVEINPRYTASVEVLEYATGLPALALHRSVFDDAFPEPGLAETALNHVVGKAILFAGQDLVFPRAGPWLAALAMRDPWKMPPFADIPAAGTPIRRGQPVLTILTAATDVAACRIQLRQTAGELDRMLFG